MEIIRAFAGKGVLEDLKNGFNSFSYRLFKENGQVAQQIPMFFSSLDSIGIDNHVQALISVCRRKDWDILRRFVKGHYPSLVPVLLSQMDLIKAVQSLKKESVQEVRVRTLSARESIGSGDEKRTRSVREWTDEVFEETLENVQDRNQTITSIELNFYPKIGAHVHTQPKTTCVLRKEGEVEVSGSFALAYKAVVAHIAKVGREKLQFYSNRGLRSADFVSRPLVVEYNRPIFDEKHMVRNLVATLAKYPHSMHAVAHGNPYAQVRMTDVYDGSSFDIWALPPSRLALIPGLKATEAAVERIVQYIFDEFREGPVKEYAELG